MNDETNNYSKPKREKTVIAFLEKAFYFYSKKYNTFQNNLKTYIL